MHSLGMVALALALTAVAAAQEPTIIRPIDEFQTPDISAWQTSMSPEYYRGGAGQKGLEVVDDPERGKVLRCDIRFVDERGSEPAFITRALDPKPSKPDVVGVRFWAKITQAAIDPAGGFKVRLRTGDTSFTDYDVQDQLGKPFPVGEWVRVELDTKIGPRVRNVWGKLFGTIRQMTFRLDDINDRNAHFALLLDDIELLMTQPPHQEAYEPNVRERADDGETRILFLKHRAAGYYNIEHAIEQVAPDARVDTFHYRGLHFEFFGFPQSAEEILAYDAIIMLDVDPFMMPHDQCAWVADAVASGAHLLLFGGPVTLTHSKAFKAPLRTVLPVTFEPEAKHIPVNAPPTPGDDHFLNQGFDPAGLGTVASVHALAPREGADVPWLANDQPLVITAPIENGRATVVNTWARVDRSPTGGFLTSTLSDDLVRRLIRHALGDTDRPNITRLTLPDLSVIGGGDVTLRAHATGRGLLEMRLTQDGARNVLGFHTGGGNWEFPITLPSSEQSESTHHYRLEASNFPQHDAVDFRDFEIEVQSPLKLDIAWERGKYTFAPGSPVEFTAHVARRDLPAIHPGARTLIEYAGGKLPVSIDSFVDSWVCKPGTDDVIHSQVGSADVKVEALGGLLPRWSVTGYPRSARTDTDVKFGDDDRILYAMRGITVHPGGEVGVRTDYEFRHDMKVQKLPLTMSFPVSVYAGMKYTVEQEEGVREGVFPIESKRGIMFDGTGMKMTIETPDGPLTIREQDPKKRVWMRDLRQYDMNVYRLEIEAPYENKEAKSGDKYRHDLYIRGPVPDSTPELRRLKDMPSISASIIDPATEFRWEVPCIETAPIPRFAGTLPNLASGQYTLHIEARADDDLLAATTRPCHVVDPLDLTDLFPIMSIVGIDGDTHYLDDAGVRARIDDLIAHGFNTAAITGTSSFKSGNPRNSYRLKGVAETYAQQRGMATTFEYSNFQLLQRNKITSPCAFSPEYHEALRSRLAWQIDVGNRTPRLMCAKVTDEPTASSKSLDHCEHCKAEFQRRYGIDLAEGIEKSDDPYTRWALADFIGAYVSEAYSHSAAIMQEENARFDLLLTYMATGLGYQRPLSYQQDALDWTRYVKWADFDVYPYFYPASQRIRMVQAGFAMTYMRDVARARGVPWGFYMELDDRNWPFQKNPKEATAECGFTAVAHGAGYLNSFINRVASTGCQARPERWEEAGRALRAIRRIGPMLNKMPAIRASVAILFPNSQEAIGNGYPTPDYALAAIKSGFGECDIYNEEVAIEKGEIPYRGLFIFKTEFIHEDLVPLLKSWLSDGGVLICDALPTKTHRGKAINWGFRPNWRPNDSLGAGASIERATARIGQGTVIKTRTDLQEKFKGFVEADKPDIGEVSSYREDIGHVLYDYVLPHVQVGYDCTDEEREAPNASPDLVAAGLRGNDDAILLTVVNHKPTPREIGVTVMRPDIKWLVDAVSMEPVEILVQHEDHGFTFTLEVPGRWARMIAGYRTKPERVEINLATPSPKRGEELRYEARILDATGEPVKGGVLLEIEVRDPEGQVVARYGGAFAPISGVQSVAVPIAINAPTGRYEITAHAPQIDAEAQSTFTVN